MDALCEAKGIGELGCSLITWGLYFGYLAFGIAFIAAVILPMINAFGNPKTLVKAGIGIAILIIIFFISYAMSDDSLTPVGLAQGITANGSKMIGAGLITFYVGLIATSIGLVYSEISKAFK